MSTVIAELKKRRRERTRRYRAAKMLAKENLAIRQERFAPIVKCIRELIRAQVRLLDSEGNPAPLPNPDLEAVNYRCNLDDRTGMEIEASPYWPHNIVLEVTDRRSILRGEPLFRYSFETTDAAIPYIISFVADYEVRSRKR